MRIHYVTGSRADFGLMRRCLNALRTSGGHEVELVVTGQHLCPQYGDTAADIRVSCLPIIREIRASLGGKDGAEMGLAMADELRGMIRLWQEERPDLVLLLGDRGEMLAGALAAVHLGIHVAHIHGGELSGTLDESFRHAISKLAHLHFPATQGAARRLARMGERPENIHVIGAPGLVGFQAEPDRSWLAARFGFSADQAIALSMFHPVVQEAATAGEQVRAVIHAAAAQGLAQIVLRPNSDAGGAAIDEALDQLQLGPLGRNIRILTHLERSEFARLLASVDLMIGNSSCGIIETASFGLPCVNIGSRQNGRERNANVIDVAQTNQPAIEEAIVRARQLRCNCANIYGEGNAHRKLVEALAGITLTPQMLSKHNGY